MGEIGQLSADFIRPQDMTVCINVFKPIGITSARRL